MGVRQVVLAFSAGKDSIAAWCALQQAGIKVIPLYHEIYPGLQIIDETMAVYERLFKTRVHRIQHRQFLMVWKELLFLDPYGVRMAEEINFWQAPPLWDNARRWMAEHGLQDSWFVSGLKMCDSPTRIMAIRLNGSINPKTKRAYVMAYASNRMVYQMLIHHGVPLPAYYAEIGESMDVLTLPMMDYIRREYPRDWETIKTYQPLIELEYARLKVGKS